MKEKKNERAIGEFIDDKLSRFGSELEDTYDEYENKEQIFEYGNIFEEVLESSINSNQSGLQVESIINSLVSGYYQIPGFQRRFVWTKKQITNLALSIIKNIPIPPIYLYVDKKTKKHVVLDGQQRVTAIFLYFMGLYFINESNRKKLDFNDIYGIKTNINQLDKKIADLQDELDSSIVRSSQNKLKQEIRELNKSRKNETIKLKDNYGLEESSFIYYDHDKNECDISIDQFDKNSKDFLLRKRIEIAVVQCTDNHPQKVYAHIFKLLNSGGKLLGTQEIRNGVYWDTDLYKNLFEINEVNNTWRKIYGKLSVFSKDVEILLKVLSLNHYTKYNGESIIVEYNGTFSWINIMESFSELCLSYNKEKIDKYTNLLKLFFNKILIDDENNKCKKAVFEAVFVAFCKLGIIYKDEIMISYSWLCSLETDVVFKQVLSNKSSIELRLSRAYKLVEEKYIE